MGASAASGIKWSAIGLIGGQVARTLVVLALARLVGPRDFGVVAQALVFLTFLQLFLDQGLGATVNRTKDLSESLLGTIVWLNALTTVALVVLTLFGAPYIASFFGTPELAPILRWLSLSVICLGLGIIPRAVLSRSLRFKRVALAEVVGSLAGGATGIVAAAMGAGTWALVVQAIVTEASITIILIASVGRLPWRPSGSALRAVAPFSLQVLGFSLLNYASRYLDNALIGKFLGPSPLAYYSLAYRVLMLPVLGLGQVTNRVALPVYARFQDDIPRFRRAFILSNRLIALVSFPLMLLIVTTAPRAVPYLFGDAWRPAILPMQLLALTGLRQSVQSTLGPVLLALGRADIQLRWGLVTSVLYVSSFIVGLQWGITGVAACYGLAGLLVAPAAMVLTARLLSFSSGAYLRTMLPSFVSALALAIATLGAMSGCDMVGAPTIATLAVSSVFGLSTYLVVLKMVWPSELQDAVNFARSAIVPRTRAAAS